MQALFKKKIHVYVPNGLDTNNISNTKFKVIEKTDTDIQTKDNIILNVASNDLLSTSRPKSLTVNILPFAKNTDGRIVTEIAKVNNANTEYNTLFKCLSGGSQYKIIPLFVLSGFENPENIYNLVDKLAKSSESKKTIVYNPLIYKDIDSLRYSLAHNADLDKELRAKQFYKLNGQNGGAREHNLVTDTGLDQLFNGLPKIYSNPYHFTKEFKYNVTAGDIITPEILKINYYDSPINYIVEKIQARQIQFVAKDKRAAQEYPIQNTGNQTLEGYIQQLPESIQRNLSYTEYIDRLIEELKKDTANITDDGSKPENTIPEIIKDLKKHITNIHNANFSSYEKGLIITTAAGNYTQQIDEKLADAITDAVILAGKKLLDITLLVFLLLGELIIMLTKITFANPGLQGTGIDKALQFFGINITQTTHEICKESMATMLQFIKQAFETDRIYVFLLDIYKRITKFYKKVKKFFKPVEPNPARTESSADTLEQSITNFTKKFEEYYKLLQDIQNAQAKTLLEFLAKDIAISTANANAKGGNKQNCTDDPLGQYLRANRYITLKTKTTINIFTEEHHKKLLKYISQIKDHRITSYSKFIKDKLHSLVKNIIAEFDDTLLVKVTDGSVTDLTDDEIKGLDLYKQLLSIICKYIEYMTRSIKETDPDIIISLPCVEPESSLTTLLRNLQGELKNKSKTEHIKLTKDELAELEVLNQLEQKLTQADIINKTKRYAIKLEPDKPDTDYIKVIFYSHNTNPTDIASIKALITAKNSSVHTAICVGPDSLNLIAKLFNISSLFSADFNKAIKTKKRIEPELTNGRLDKQLSKTYKQKRYTEKALANLYGKDLEKNNNTRAKLGVRKASTLLTTTAREKYKGILQAELAKLDAEHQENAAEIERLNTEINTITPESGIQLTEQGKIEQQMRINKHDYLVSRQDLITSEIAELNNMITKLNEITGAQAKYIYRDTKEIFDKAKEIYRFEYKINDAQAKKSALEEKLNKLRAGVFTRFKKGDITKLEREIVGLEGKITGLQSQLDTRKPELIKHRLNYNPNLANILQEIKNFNIGKLVKPKTTTATKTVFLPAREVNPPTGLAGLIGSNTRKAGIFTHAQAPSNLKTHKTAFQGVLGNIARPRTLKAIPPPKSNTTVVGSNEDVNFIEVPEAQNPIPNTTPAAVNTKQVVYAFTRVADLIQKFNMGAKGLTLQHRKPAEQTTEQQPAEQPNVNSVD